MITVHILEANLKMLPGKIILLHAEPLTHSLPPGQQRSHLLRSRGERECSLPAPQSVLSTAQGPASNLSGRDGFQGWQDRCTLLGTAPEHTEHWHPGRHCSFLGSPGVQPELHPQESPAESSRVTCPFPATVGREMLWVLPSKELATKKIVLNALKKNIKKGTSFIPFPCSRWL